MFDIVWLSSRQQWAKANEKAWLKILKCMFIYMYKHENIYISYIYIVHSFYREILKIVYKPVLSLQVFSLPQAWTICMLCLEFEDPTYQKCGCSPCPEDLCWERLDRKDCCMSGVNRANSWQSIRFFRWFTYQWPCFLLVCWWFFFPQPFCVVWSQLLKCCLY